MGEEVEEVEWTVNVAGCEGEMETDDIRRKNRAQSETQRTWAFVRSTAESGGALLARSIHTTSNPASSHAVPRPFRSPLTPCPPPSAIHSISKDPYYRRFRCSRPLSFSSTSLIATAASLFARHSPQEKPISLHVRLFLFFFFSLPRVSRANQSFDRALFADCRVYFIRGWTCLAFCFARFRRIGLNLDRLRSFARRQVIACLPWTLVSAMLDGESRESFDAGWRVNES